MICYDNVNHSIPTHSKSTAFGPEQCFQCCTHWAPGISSCVDWCLQDLQPNSAKLTNLEEEAMLRHVLDLDLRGFSPRLTDVEDIANLLLADRDAGRVGKCWALNYVMRQPELKTRLNRPYDYQRALCEDPEKIQAWFDLVRNMQAKYGIEDTDVYNFDETGFMCCTAINGSDAC